jgi:uncharacterized damage-inducible protein DinB
MTPVDLLANGFARIPTAIQRAISGLDAQQVATPPAPHANTLAWLTWHIARGQDAWISDLEGREEVWTADGWQERFALPFAAEENGFGMPEDAVMLVVAAPTLLTAYLDTVTARTLAYLQTLTSADLDEIVDHRRTPPVSRGVQLLSILDDGLQHAGQASYVRGILNRTRHVLDLDTERTPT